MMGVFILIYAAGMASGALLEKTYFSKHSFSDFLPPAVVERHNAGN